MPNEIKDWKIKLGMDLSDVEKGLKQVDKLFSKINKTMKIKAPVEGVGRGSSARGRRGGVSTSGAEGRQFRAETRIISAEERGERLLGKIDPSTTDRRLKAIREEAKRVIEELNSLKAVAKKTTTGLGFDKVSRKVGELNRQLGGVTQSFNRTTRAMEKQKIAANGLKDSMRNLVRSYASVFAIVGTGRAFFNVGKELDSLGASLLAASGDAKTAASNFEFLTRTARDLGQPLTEGFRGFNRMGTAARSMGLSVDESREVFLATQQAATAFSLDAQRSGLVMLAFSQIMSKGRVSMEEMSRQLGENLPIAWEAAERALGKSRSEIMKMIEAGKLSSDQFILPFARAVSEITKESGALAAGMKKVRAEQNRFVGVTQLGVKKGFDAGKGGFAGFFKDLTEITEELTPAFKVFGRLFGGVARALSFTLKLLIPVVNIVANSFDKLTTAMDNAIDPTKRGRDLSLIEGFFRRMSGFALIIAGSLELVAAGIQEVAEFLGVSEDKSQNFLVSIVSWATALVTVLGVYKLISSVVRGITGTTKKMVGSAKNAVGLSDGGKSGGKGTSRFSKITSGAARGGTSLLKGGVAGAAILALESHLLGDVLDNIDKNFKARPTLEQSFKQQGSKAPVVVTDNRTLNLTFTGGVEDNETRVREIFNEEVAIAASPSP